MTEWLTVQEACTYLKINRRTLYKYTKMGKLPYYQLGGSGNRRFKKEDLDALLELGQEIEKAAQVKT